MDDHRLIEIEEDHEGFRNEEEEEEEGEEALLEGEDFEDEDEDAEDYEDEEEAEEEEAEEPIPAEMTSPSVSTSIADCTTLLGNVGINDGLLNDSNNGGKEELIRGENEGLFCPICYEAWSSGGDHRICCLPCGHIYGLSCIKKWLQRRQAPKKCPQCNALCTLKDVRLIFAKRLCATDEDLHKRVRLLEAKCAHLEKKPISNEGIAMQVSDEGICDPTPNEPEIDLRYLARQNDLLGYYMDDIQHQLIMMDRRNHWRWAHGPEEPRPDFMGDLPVIMRWDERMAGLRRDGGN